ncbi:hypothetical protein LguiA_003523 [Lonicera macranthoides]
MMAEKLSEAAVPPLGDVCSSGLCLFFELPSLLFIYDRYFNITKTMASNGREMSNIQMFDGASKNRCYQNIKVSLYNK